MRTIALWLCMGCALGCTPTIPDGRIGCHDPDRTCPAGFSCAADRLCRRMPSSDGGTPTTDAFVPHDDGGASCTSNAQCTLPTTCIIGRWGEGVGGRCADAATVLPATHGAACSNDDGCTMPDACIDGACIRPCAMTSSPCGADENCAPTPPDVSPAAMACLAGCTGTTCADSDFFCRTPPDGSGRATCFPRAWMP